MIRMQASWVRQVMDLMSFADLPCSASLALILLAASMAVWEWNSAGKDIISASGSGSVERLYLGMRL